MNGEVELARVNETLRAVQHEIHLLRIVLMARLSDAQAKRAQQLMAKDGASASRALGRDPAPAAPAPLAPSATAKSHERFDSGGS